MSRKAQDRLKNDNSDSRIITVVIFDYLQTFDECVDKQGHDCDPEHLWLQIPFFCGQDAECWYVLTHCYSAPTMNQPLLFSEDKYRNLNLRNKVLCFPDRGLRCGKKESHLKDQDSHLSTIKQVDFFSPISNYILVL